MHIFFFLLVTFNFNILWQSLNVKHNLSPLLATFGNALNAHCTFFLSSLPYDFLFCCNCWNVFLPFLAPWDFWYFFIVVVDNCSNTSCYNCWSIFPTFLFPCNFWCWFIVVANGCYKISLVVVFISYSNCWNVVPTQMSIVSTEIETHLIIAPLHQPTR